MHTSLTVAILLVILNDCVHSHAFSNLLGRFKMELDTSSGVTFKSWPIQEDPSKQCTGTNRNIEIRIQFDDLTGCFIFKTPGFGEQGYPNASNGLNAYTCTYKSMFGRTKVSGTLTVPASSFDFQPPVGGRCKDDLTITNIESSSTDSDDAASSRNTVKYCGSISGDKALTFDTKTLSIKITGDGTINGNGAEVILCFD